MLHFARVNVHVEVAFLALRASPKGWLFLFVFSVLDYISKLEYTDVKSGFILNPLPMQKVMFKLAEFTVGASIGMFASLVVFAIIRSI